MSEIKPQTMLYRPGAMITCGPHSLDYVIVNDDEIKNWLAKGYYKTPQEAAEAEEKEREEATQRALEAQAAAQQKLIDEANNSGNGTKTNPRQRKPKKTSDDKNGDLGANQTNPDGGNPDAEGGDEDHSDEQE